MKTLLLTGAVLLLVLSFKAGAGNPFETDIFSDPPSTQYKSHSEQMRELEERHEAQLQINLSYSGQWVVQCDEQVFLYESFALKSGSRSEA